MLVQSSSSAGKQEQMMEVLEFKLPFSTLEEITNRHGDMPSGPFLWVQGLGWMRSKKCRMTGAKLLYKLIFLYMSSFTISLYFSAFANIISALLLSAQYVIINCLCVCLFLILWVPWWQELHILFPGLAWCLWLINCSFRQWILNPL